MSTRGATRDRRATKALASMARKSSIDAWGGGARRGRAGPARRSPAPGPTSRRGGISAGELNEKAPASAGGDKRRRGRRRPPSAAVRVDRGGSGGTRLVVRRRVPFALQQPRAPLLELDLAPQLRDLQALAVRRRAPGTASLASKCRRRPPLDGVVERGHDGDVHNSDGERGAKTAKPSPAKSWTAPVSVDGTIAAKLECLLPP